MENNQNIEYVRELNREHLEFVNKRLSGIFVLGFVCGIVFSYCGIIGFLGGGIVGLFISKMDVSTSNTLIDVFTNAFNQAKILRNKIDI